MNLSQEIIKGDRTALAKGITLIESTLPKDKIKAQEVLKSCIHKSGNSIRIGVTGVPGVGKSTFIETFGLLLTSKGHKVAVLAIDPSSERTYGSILGDKNRMNKLATNSNAFIRPSPSSGTLGGVTDKTRDSIILCEAAGFDIILIETVGVGQSETTVKNLVDFFLLLMLSGAGDELQGIKRGIMELADALVITKDDGDNMQNSKNAALEYKRALHLFPGNENGWICQVSTCSAIKDTGIKPIIETIYKFDTQMKNNRWKTRNRINQDKYWLHLTLRQELGNIAYNQLLEEGKILQLEEELENGKNINQLIANL